MKRKKKGRKEEKNKSKKDREKILFFKTLKKIFLKLNLRSNGKQYGGCEVRRRNPTTSQRSASSDARWTNLHGSTARIK